MRSATAAIRRLAGALALSLVAAFPARADRNALWTLVREQCVPHAEAGEAPKPCEAVDLAAGYVVLKDRNGVAQYLVMPTRKLAGIEDPFILSPDAPNYFAAAWAARARVEAKLGKPLPREATSIAINSAYGRSQDQLHLHVDCLSADAMKEILAERDGLDDTWRPMGAPIAGRVFLARRLLSEDLTDARPFELLAEGVDGARAHMDAQTLAVVGATFDGKPGFVLLADHAELEGGGSAEIIQDHDCAVAK